MKKIGAITRWLPPLADLVFITLFLYLSVFSGDALLEDCDTGFHIRTGEYILNTQSVPRFDIFSFSKPAMPWTAHEWLSEAIMALIHKSYGLTGVAVFFSLIISASYYALFMAVRRWGANIFVVLAVTGLAVASSELHWLARPHIFSLILTVAWLSVLDTYEYRDRSRVLLLLLLPLLMLAWVNLHGSFITGLLLNVIYLAGNFSRWFFSREGIFLERTKWILTSTAGCLGASLINPYGYKILSFPFKLVSNRTIMDNVNEFLSPDFHEPMFFTVLLLLLIAFLAVSRTRLDVIEVMLLLLFTYMALYSVRYIPLFAIITAPLIARHSSRCEMPDGRFLRSLSGLADRMSRWDRSATRFLWPVFVTLAVIVLASMSKIHYAFDEDLKPVKAAEFLNREQLPGNMFDNDEFGDYLIYAAWPKYRVFLDGRSDMYGEERMKEYFQVARVKGNWEEVLNKYRINWIIFNSDSTLSRLLLGRSDWKLIYADDVADIFIRNTPENRGIIEKYKDVKPAVDSEEE